MFPEMPDTRLGGVVNDLAEFMLIERDQFVSAENLAPSADRRHRPNWLRESDLAGTKEITTVHDYREDLHPLTYQQSSGVVTDMGLLKGPSEAVAMYSQYKTLPERYLARGRQCFVFLGVIANKLLPCALCTHWKHATCFNQTHLGRAHASHIQMLDPKKKKKTNKKAMALNTPLTQEGCDLSSTACQWPLSC